MRPRTISELVDPAAACRRGREANRAGRNTTQSTAAADHQRQGDRHGVEHRRHNLPAAIDEGGEVAGDEELLHHGEYWT